MESRRDLLQLYARELTMVESVLRRRLAGHAGYEAIQAIHGVGPIMAAIFVAEIGDVGRFPDARHLSSWAGMTPSHRESDRAPVPARSTEPPIRDLPRGAPTSPPGIGVDC